MVMVLAADKGNDERERERGRRRGRGVCVEAGVAGMTGALTPSILFFNRFFY